jgi:hypothetical protein
MARYVFQHRALYHDSPFSQPVYVAKDTIETIVTLANPFGIDLEIQNMSLR